MTTIAVAVAVLFLGIPAVIFGVNLIWSQANENLSNRTSAVAVEVERQARAGNQVSSDLLDSFASRATDTDMYFQVTYDGDVVVEGGTPIEGEVLRDAIYTNSGPLVVGEIPRSGVLWRVFQLVVAAAALILIAFSIGVAVALQQSRKLSAPLIYLAASAEQLGEGQVRPHIEPSGIEEIDLVYQELDRTAERMAGRISAERQFAADAAHQLRTPLAALSMRLEEIDYLSDDPAVKEEAQEALSQIDRLGNVVNELMKNVQENGGGSTEATSLAEIFDQQKKEWRLPFRRAGRKLEFSGGDFSVLAQPGSVSQIVATLVENSLKYGAGTTSVTASSHGKTGTIKVSDEGEGVDESIADDIFEKGVSGGGSSGIGLAVARNLAEADGGRLELTRQVPAEFTLTMSSVPKSLDPAKVLPSGALVSMNSRRSRR